jgi:hypothetical protein
VLYNLKQQKKVQTKAIIKKRPIKNHLNLIGRKKKRDNKEKNW